MRTIEGPKSADGFRFAVVVARFNDFVTDRLEKGALAALEAAAVRTGDVTIVRVPGAFEIPMAARHAAETGQFDAVICLGCLIRGATPHFEYISSAVAHGLTNAAADTGVPMTFGVLTTNAVEEALERAVDGPANKGWEAATAAIEMAGIATALRSLEEAAPRLQRSAGQPAPRRRRSAEAVSAKAEGLPAKADERTS
jgi:6,7-dimethyl-8-ribityllumazine synthase